MMVPVYDAVQQCMTVRRYFNWRAAKMGHIKRKGGLESEMLRITEELSRTKQREGTAPNGFEFRGCHQVRVIPFLIRWCIN